MSVADELASDHAHVLLDALSELRKLIERGDVKPWSTYEGGPADPKTHEGQYLRLLGEAEDTLTALADLAFAG